MAKTTKTKTVTKKKVTKAGGKKKTTTTRKSSGRRTEAHMRVEVNGRKMEHPVRKFFIALGFILCPLVVGLISSALTGDAMMTFGDLNQPPLAPPAWLFPVAWTILYLLMGVASYLIYRWQPKDKVGKALKVAELVVYFVQLAFNFMWTILFFRFELRYFAFGWLVVMWLMILALIIMAFKTRKAAAWCLIPYLLWCTFAAYLNIMVAVLN